MTNRRKPAGHEPTREPTIRTHIPSSPDEAAAVAAVAAGSKSKSSIPKPKTEAEDTDSDFDEFWSVYPRREGGSPKTPARAKWRAARRRGVPAAEIIAGAKRYADLRQREIAAGKSEPRFTAMAQTWLNQERWRTDEPPEGIQVPGAPSGQNKLRPDSMTLERWKTAVGYFRSYDEWLVDCPPPGVDGCMAPSDVLAGFGFRSSPEPTHIAA